MIKGEFQNSPLGIEANDVCVDYNGTVALYDASLHLPAGCICGLVGMNGAGKSTLFKALTGFVRPSRGRPVHCRGRPQGRGSRTRGNGTGDVVVGSRWAEWAEGRQRRRQRSHGEG